jgi:hypothetical protein
MLVVVVAVRMGLFHRLKVALVEMVAVVLVVAVRLLHPIQEQMEQ